MTKLFLKIPPAIRSLIMLVCAFGAYLLMTNENQTLQIIGYVLLGLMAVFIFYDRKAVKIAREEKMQKEREKEDRKRVAVSKNPFDDTKGGYVLKWAYYNENIAGCRYLNIPYKELKVGSTLRLVKDKLNAHDKNAIKVFYENHHVGFIHKNHIQEMFNKYSEDENYIIEVKLNSIDETNCRLQLQIGFYQLFNEKAFRVNQVIKFVLVSTFNKQDAWKNVNVNNYLRVDYNESGLVYKDDVLIGELKGSDLKKLSNFSRDFRIVYKVGLVTGNEEKHNLTGRVDAYVIED